MQHVLCANEMRNFRGTTLLSLLVDGGIFNDEILLSLIHADVTVQMLFLFKRTRALGHDRNHHDK